MENYRLIRSTDGGDRTTLRHVLVGAGLLLAGLWAGSGTLPPSQAWGEVRIAPPPKAFETGGQISVPILKEMAATLHQMDARLARMETVAGLVQSQLLLDQKSQ